LLTLSETCTLGKPCSVRPCGRGSHLSVPLGTSHLASVRLREFSYQIWISRLRGLSRSTRHVSMAATSLWHVMGTGHGFPFRLPPAVSLSAAWPYWLDQRKHYHRRRWCEHGLSSEGIAPSDCL